MEPSPPCFWNQGFDFHRELTPTGMWSTSKAPVLTEGSKLWESINSLLEHWRGAWEGALSVAIPKLWLLGVQLFTSEHSFGFGCYWRMCISAFPPPPPRLSLHKTIICVHAGGVEYKLKSELVLKLQNTFCFQQDILCITKFLFLPILLFSTLKMHMKHAW